MGLTEESNVRLKVRDSLDSKVVSSHRVTNHMNLKHLLACISVHIPLLEVGANVGVVVVGKRDKVAAVSRRWAKVHVVLKKKITAMESTQKWNEVMELGGKVSPAVDVLGSVKHNTTRRLEQQISENGSNALELRGKSIKNTSAEW